MDPQQIMTAFAIRTWQQVVARIGNLCSPLSEDQLRAEIAPGKNRLIYLWGHLAAIHDAMFPILRLGDRLHPELDLPFVSKPDRSMKLPTAAEIKTCWDEVRSELVSRSATLALHQWFERNGNVSEAEFDLDPTRNRLAVLLSRTNHASYHLGQMMLAQQPNAERNRS